VKSGALVLGLGIDAGGTQTRWALAAEVGDIVAEGAVRGMSALQVGKGNHVREAMADLAAAAHAHGKPASIHAGVTGFGENVETLRALIAAPFGLEPATVTLASDMEIAYLDLFAPGEGYMVYAGTGSVAAFIDAEGTLHRAGGRGVVVDDGGSGFWIAREAMRRVWRIEDQAPGSWRASPLATALFEAVGGSDWAHSREYIYGGDRGAVGRLALAVARAAGTDPAAQEILADAGRELARLAIAMTRRYGPRPVALAGRAAEIHPLIFETMRKAVPPDTPLRIRASQGHRAAARIALQKALA
jgi:N-acetylglucosamine kinase-like BadF-type ATPase